jgi:thymidylate synthase (FAD)
MKQCNISLENYTPLWVGSSATRTCWASFDKSDTGEVWECADCGYTSKGPFEFNDFGHMYCTKCGSTDIAHYIKTGDNDKALIDRVGNKFKHASTLEHLYYNFHISDISRACLQELARHRIASLSVKSTRYTLKELKEEDSFNDFSNELDYKRASKYVVWTGVHNVDITIFFMLEDLRSLIKEGISNDKAKFALPEAYKTELAWSINARSLQNFLALRTNKAALWEIRELAYAVYEAIPEEHKFLFDDSIYKEKDSNEKKEK